MKLVLFTNSYPYGIGELWKQNELKLLLNKFDEIQVIPLSYGGNKHPKLLCYKTLFFEVPLLDSLNIKVTYLNVFKFIFGKLFTVILNEFLCIRFNLTKNNIIKIFNSTKKVKLILDNDIIKKLLSSDNSNTILYFYWGLGTSEIIPFLDISRFKKVIIRMHRYDLYEYENDNYIPFRKQLLQKKIIVLPSSDDGCAHLHSIYSDFRALIKTQRCGVMKSLRVTKGIEKKKLIITSCSMLVSLKRIERMIKEASLLDIPFEWFHIGYGELELDLYKLIVELNLENKFKLIGKIDSELILDFYLEKDCDLFINTSRSEGVPFSIMEALSVGIPVIATDAGGTREIIDSQVGQLLKNDFCHGDLKKAIERYYFLSNSDKLIMRKNALKRFSEKCDMDKLTIDFLDILLN